MLEETNTPGPVKTTYKPEQIDKQQHERLHALGIQDFHENRAVFTPMREVVVPPAGEP
jgi:hypothetical protein